MQRQRSMVRSSRCSRNYTIEVAPLPNPAHEPFVPPHGLGVRQSSGALEVVGCRKRQRTGAVQDADAIKFGFRRFRGANRELWSVDSLPVGRGEGEALRDLLLVTKRRLSAIRGEYFPLPIRWGEGQGEGPVQLPSYGFSLVASGSSLKVGVQALACLGGAQPRHRGTEIQTDFKKAPATCRCCRPRARRRRPSAPASRGKDWSLATGRSASGGARA